MEREELIAFTRQIGLAVVATLGPDGAPQAALVGVAATDVGELVFDTSDRRIATGRRMQQPAVGPAGKLSGTRAGKPPSA